MSLLNRLNAIKEIKAIRNSISDNAVSQDDAETLIHLCRIIYTKLNVTKDAKGDYDIDRVNALCEKCISTVKREYTAKLFEDIALIRMLEDDL